MNPILQHARFALALMAAAGGLVFAAPAQEPPQPPPIIEPGDVAELASNLVLHVMGVVDTNEVMLSNSPPELSDAAALSHIAQPAPSGSGVSSQREPISPEQERGGDRRSFRRSGSGNSGFSRSSREEGSREPETGSVAGSGNSLSAGGRPDFSSFKVVTERNIFDPNRRPYRPSAPREGPKTVESFSLVGVMSYEKGTFAFFDGTSSSFRKALKQNDLIAGYRVASINSSAVQLASGTNQLELHVGMQLRREDEGEWIPSRRTEPFAAPSPAATTSIAPTSNTQTDSAAAGGESEVLKRLRERRERE